MSTFFHGITEIIPSLFREFCRNEIPFPTLTMTGVSGLSDDDDGKNDGLKWKLADSVR